MRQFSNTAQPPNYPQFYLNQRGPIYPSSTHLSRDEASRRNTDSVNLSQFSNASMEDELKRIENYLQTDTKTYFQNLGVDLSRQDKAKDTTDFHTASFKNKEVFQSSKLKGLSEKLPVFSDSGIENGNFQEEYEEQSLQQSMESSTQYQSEDQSIIQQALKRINQRSSPFYQEIHNQINKQQQFEQVIKEPRLPTSPQNDSRDFKAEIENTFGIQKYTGFGSRNSNETKNNKWIPPLFSISDSRTSSERKIQQVKADYSDYEESTMTPSPTNSKVIDVSPKNNNNKNYGNGVKSNLSTIPPKVEALDVDHFLKNLMVPRRMKISIGGVPFQEVIFVLALKFFEKSSYFENFVFEWLDVRTTGMIGYIKLDYIKYVYKQGQKRFNIACKDPRNDGDSDEDVLHYVHIEASNQSQCELYVNGLNAVMKYMEKSVKG